MWVTVYAGSADRASPRFVKNAASFGQQLAARNIGIVYGGGRTGVMGALADAAIAAGGQVVGVTPRSLVGPESAHSGLTELHIVRSMHQRKQMMIDLGDCSVALPGGVGTADEIFDCWTSVVLGSHSKAVMLLNSDGYWASLLQLADDMVAHGFVTEYERGLLQSISDIHGLLDVVRNWKTPTPRRGQSVTSQFRPAESVISALPG